MTEILKIINSEPFGMFPHKAEQIAEILLLEDAHVCNVIDYQSMGFKIMQTYTRLTMGEKKKMLTDNAYSRPQEVTIWQPVLLTKERLYAGEEPNPVHYTQKQVNDLVFQEHTEQYNQAKEQVWFDGWKIHNKECNSFENKEVIVAKMVFTKSINQFVIATGTPYNENFVNLLII